MGDKKMVVIQRGIFGRGKPVLPDKGVILQRKKGGLNDGSPFLI
jgi:hypothetical protein